MPLLLNESLVLWVFLGYGSAYKCWLLKVWRCYGVEAYVGRTKMNYEMTLTTCTLQVGLCFCEIFSVNDMTGHHSILPNLRSGLFLRSLVCLWNFVHTLSKSGFLNLSTIDILGPGDSFLWGHLWFLFSRYQKYLPPPKKFTTKSVFRQCQVFLGEQNRPWLRATDLDERTHKTSELIPLFIPFTNISWVPTVC